MKPSQAQIEEWYEIAEKDVTRTLYKLVQLAYAAGAEAALAKLRGDGVEFDKELKDFLFQLVHGDFMADNPEDLTAAMNLPHRIRDYGDRRAAAQAAIPKVNYAPLYEYAKANKVNYNQLCAIVGAAVGIGEPTPEAL